MDQYKCAIEAIVRPLRASERRKNILRRELWSHFCALMDAARAGTRDEASAAHEALERLGTAGEIRRTFHASIPRIERMGYRLDSAVRRRSGEAAGRYVARLMMSAALGYAMISAFIVACIELLGRDMSPTRWAMILMLVGTQVVFASVYLCSVTLRLDLIETRLRRATLMGSSKIEWARIAAGVAFAGIPLGAVTAAGGYAILGMLVGFNRSDTLEFLYIAPPLIGFLWLQFAFLIPFSLLRDAQHANPIPDWPYEATLS